MIDKKPLLAAEFELIRFDCSKCGRHIRATPGSTGKQFQCRRCGETLTVPFPAQVHQESAAPPKRRSLVWAIVLGSIGINAIVIAGFRRDSKPIPAPAPDAVTALDAEQPEVAETAPEVTETPVIKHSLIANSPPAASPDIAPVQGTEKKQPASPKAAMPDIAKNPETRFQSYLQSAEAGDAKAMHEVGLCYETGSGIEQDLETAAAWYEEAATAGNAAAMYKIGLCYAVGKGVDKDEELATQWLNESANAGYADAKPALGLLKAGIPAFLVAAWMARPIGELPRAEPATDEGSPPRLIPAERRSEFVQRMMGGGRNRSSFEPWRNFNSPGEARQRDRFMRGMSQRTH